MSLAKSRIFLIFCLSFILGVWLGKYLSLEIMALLAIFFVMVATVGWENKNCRVIGLAGLVLLIGSLRMFFYWNDGDWEKLYSKNLETTGVIVEEPDVRNDKTYLTMGKISINGKSVAGRVLLTVGQTNEYKYGQRLKFAGKLAEPKDAPPGEFSYKNYLSRFGVFATVYFPRVEEAEDGFGNPVKNFLFSIKQSFVRTLALLFPEPQNSFLSALLVGLRRSIPQDLLDAFNATGTTHVIAISGFNIMIIIKGLDKLFLRFGRRISLIACLVVILGFVILSGASASVVRAAIMGVLLLISLNIGRLYAVTNALALTAVFMLAINPLILHYDVGFQLSFLALMGLVYLCPLLAPAFRFGSKTVTNFLNGYLAPTLAAQIFVLPILLYDFDRISLVAPFTNILILPLIPATMLFGFIAGAAGLIWLPLGLPAASVGWLLLSYIIKVVEFTSKIPFASIQIDNFSLAFLVIYYFILAAVLVFYYHPGLRAKVFTKKQKSAKLVLN